MPVARGVGWSDRARALRRNGVIGCALASALVLVACSAPSPPAAMSSASSVPLASPVSLPTGSSPRPPISPPDATSLPAPSATVPANLDPSAAQAVSQLYAGLGSPAQPGASCLINPTPLTVSFAHCPVTARLAARLAQTDGVGAFPLFAFAPVSNQEVSISIAATMTSATGTAIVSILIVPGSGAGARVAFRIDAAAVASGSGWAVDDLRFYGDPNGTTPDGAAAWMPGVAGGPYSIYAGCWFAQVREGEGC